MTKVFSATIAGARRELLGKLKYSLSKPITDALEPRGEGEPFVDLKRQPPQIRSLQSLINTLYHAEQLARTWEGLDTTSLAGKLAAPKAAFNALQSTYKVLALLNDSSPEIQKLIRDNYDLLAPVFNEALRQAKDSGYLDQLGRLGVVEQASQALGAGVDLLNPDSMAKLRDPLVNSIQRLSHLSDWVVKANQQGLSEPEKKQAMAELDSLLADFDQLNWLEGLTLNTLEESSALTSLAGWMKALQENQFVLTEQAVQGYEAWHRQSMPALLVLVDTLEQQNYLRPGLLADPMSQASDRLATAINQVASELQLDAEPVQPVANLVEVRHHALAARQQDLQQAVASNIRQQETAEQFFSLLEPYRDEYFDRIPESVRVELRRLYPSIQIALAHQDFDQDARIIAFLKQTGPAEYRASWGATLGWRMRSEEVNGILRTYSGVEAYLNTEAQSLALKQQVNSEAADHLGYSLADAPEEKREDQAEAEPVDLQPVQSSSIYSIRGNLAWLQEMRLSEKVDSLSDSFAELIAEKQIQIEEHPALGQLQSGMDRLADLLADFEQMQAGQPLANQTLAFANIVKQAHALYQNLRQLDAQSREQISPILVALTDLTQSMSKLSVKASRPAEIKKIDILPVEPDKKKDENKKEGLLDRTVKRVKAVALDQLSNIPARLSPVIASQLQRREQGVPFPYSQSSAPQVRAIQEIYNSVYYFKVAQKALLAINTSSLEGKILAAHHSSIVLSSLHQLLSSLNEAAPEVQQWLAENGDLILPVLADAQQWLKDSGIVDQAAAINLTQVLGQAAGIGLNELASLQGGHLQSQSALSAISQIPQWIRKANDSLSGKPMTEKSLKLITANDLAAMNSLLDAAVNPGIKPALLSRGPAATMALMRLVGSFVQEGRQLSATSLGAWQQFLQEEYPVLIQYLDQLEQVNYLKPGLLTDSIQKQVDALSEQVKRYAKTTLIGKTIPELATGADAAQRLAAMSERRQALVALEAKLAQSGAAEASPARQRVQLQIEVATAAMCHLVGTAPEISPPTEAEIEAAEIPDESRPGSLVRQTGTVIQSLHLSTQIRDWQAGLEDELERRFSPRVMKQFSREENTQRYLIGEDDLQLVKEIKAVNNSLLALADLLAAFEKIDSQTPLASQMRLGVQLSISLYDLKQSIDNLSPEAARQFKSGKALMKSLETDLGGLSMSNLMSDKLALKLAPLEAEYKKEKINKKKLVLKGLQALPGMLQTEALSAEQKGEMVKTIRQTREVYGREVIKPMAAQERSLGLKAGTLVIPALQAFDEALLAALGEVNLPLDQKIDLLAEQHQFHALIDELARLDGSTPLDKDLLTDQRRVMTDYLAGQPNEQQKNQLVEFDLNSQLRSFRSRAQSLNSPLREEYEIALSTFARQQAKAPLSEALQAFEKDFLFKYQKLDKGIQMLDNFSAGLEPVNQETKDYLQKQSAQLKDNRQSLDDRLAQMVDLPKQAEFKQQLAKVSYGINFLEKFSQFVERVAESIRDAVQTGRNVFDLYREKKLEDSLQVNPQSQDKSEIEESSASEADADSMSGMSPS